MDRALGDATAFVIVEANLALVSNTVARHLQGMPKTEFLWTAAAVGGRVPVSANDEGAIRAGLFTSNKYKHAMMDQIKQYLRGRRIWWHKERLPPPWLRPDVLSPACTGARRLRDKESRA